MSPRRTYNDTTHDTDAICEKLQEVADTISELDVTGWGIKDQLARIAAALERLAPAATTSGTTA
jgi:archaellum component FlaC